MKTVQKTFSVKIDSLNSTFHAAVTAVCSTGKVHSPTEIAAPITDLSRHLNKVHLPSYSQPWPSLCLGKTYKLVVPIVNMLRCLIFSKTRLQFRYHQRYCCKPAEQDRANSKHLPHTDSNLLGHRIFKVLF